MPLILTLEKQHEGKTVSVIFSHQYTPSTVGIGCFSMGVTGWGTCWIAGVEVFDPVLKTALLMGRKPDLAPDWSSEPIHGHLVTPDQVAKAGLSTTLIRDWIYEMIAGAKLAGALLFGDRINRGSPASPVPKATKWGDVTFSPGALAKWLSKRPDLGFLMASPVFNNPNHSSRLDDYSLVQFWAFFHKDNTPYMYTDEAEGFVQPDIQLPKETFLKNFSAKFGKDITKYSSVTYDG